MLGYAVAAIRGSILAYRQTANASVVDPVRAWTGGARRDYLRCVVVKTLLRGC